MKSIALFFVCACLFTRLNAQPVVIENNQLKLNYAVLFKPGTAKLLPESDSALMQVQQFLNDKTYISLLRVEGHMSAGANEAALQTLSENRALAVCRWLTEKGVDSKRLLPVGFGSTKPAFANNTPEGRAANNRIVFVMAALRGRLIGGMPADGGGKIAGAN